MEDNEGDALEILRSKVNKAQAQRERHEVTPVAFTDRRKMIGQPTKNTQLNLKVTARFKSMVIAAAVSRKVSATALVEDAVTAYLKGAGR